MPHDYTSPTKTELYAEAISGDIIKRQRASEDAWQKLIALTIESVNRIDFPIAFPCPGYDKESALSLLWDLMVIAPLQDEAQRAFEMAEEQV